MFLLRVRAAEDGPTAATLTRRRDRFRGHCRHECNEAARQFVTHTKPFDARLRCSVARAAPSYPDLLRRPRVNRTLTEIFARARRAAGRPRRTCDTCPLRGLRSRSTSRSPILFSGNCGWGRTLERGRMELERLARRRSRWGRSVAPARRERSERQPATGPSTNRSAASPNVTPFVPDGPWQLSQTKIGAAEDEDGRNFANLATKSPHSTGPRR